MTVTSEAVRRPHTPPGTSFTRTVKITPDLAKEWLKRNTHNRRLNQDEVELLAGAMKRGEWMDNGDPFARFDADGNILDGQHRLHALIKANFTWQGYIVDGLAPEVQRVIDIGQPRTFAQELGLDGYVNPNQLAAVALGVFRWENGDWNAKTRKATRIQLRNLVELNEAPLQDAVRAAHRLNNKLRVAPTSAALAYWLFAQIDQEDADDFFDRLTNGTVEPSHPIGLLRERLIEWMRARHGDKPSRQMILAYFIKAWNFYRNGEHPAYLVFRPGGKTPEKWPLPV